VAHGCGAAILCTLVVTVEISPLHAALGPQLLGGVHETIVLAVARVDGVRLNGGLDDVKRVAQHPVPKPAQQGAVRSGQVGGVPASMLARRRPPHPPMPPASKTCRGLRVSTGLPLACSARKAS